MKQIIVSIVFAMLLCSIMFLAFPPTPKYQMSYGIRVHNDTIWIHDPETSRILDSCINCNITLDSIINKLNN